MPKEEELEGLGLKCIPGRTIVKIGEPPVAPETSEEESDDDARRTHMRFKTDDEICQVCVCSVEGKDVYCSNRPAMNVNECLMLTKVMGKFKQNLPFEHEKSLAFRIRRG